MLTSFGCNIKGRGLVGEFVRLRFSEQLDLIADDLDPEFWTPESILVGRSYGGYLLLHALAELTKVIPAIKLVLVGTGVDFDKTRALAHRLGLDEQVMFLGFRRDVPEILPIADVGVSTSRHEGLGLGVAEQMMCGVPVVASLDKGHAELVDHESNGYLYRQGDRDDFCGRILALQRHFELRQELGSRACRSMEKFHLDMSLEAMSRIYENYL
ncbi:MAG: glycosyltransferase [Thermodesulfobacteriota bacterium]